MKLTWKKMFDEFRDSYPELWCRGTSFMPYEPYVIQVVIPDKGKLLYSAETDDITWLERWTSDKEQKRIEREQRPKMYDVFCDAVVDYLHDSNLTHQEFADRVGVSRRSLSKYLNGDRIPKVSTMQQIGEVIGIEFNI